MSLFSQLISDQALFTRRKLFSDLDDKISYNDESGSDHVLSTSTLNLSSESDETKSVKINDSGLCDLSISGSNLGKFTSVYVEDS